MEVKADTDGPGAQRGAQSRSSTRSLRGARSVRAPRQFDEVREEEEENRERELNGWQVDSAAPLFQRLNMIMHVDCMCSPRGTE